MTSLEQTVHHARSHGYNTTAIDNDCFLIGTWNDWIVQVSYDRFSPSGKFINAVTPDGREFKSYAGVRKYVEGERS